MAIFLSEHFLVSVIAVNLLAVWGDLYMVSLQKRWSLLWWVWLLLALACCLCTIFNTSQLGRV